MPNAIVRASTTALPTCLPSPLVPPHPMPADRRAFLRSATPPSPPQLCASAALASPANGDAEIIELGAEVERLTVEAKAIHATRIEPFEDEWCRILRSGPMGRVTDESCKRALAFYHACGRGAAAEEVEEVYSRADRVYLRLAAIPAKSQAAKVAKVRAFLIYIGGNDWLGGTDELK